MARRNLLSHGQINFTNNNNSTSSCSDDDLENDFEMVSMVSARDEIRNDENFDDLAIVEGIEVFEDLSDDVFGMGEERNVLLRDGPRVQEYFCEVLNYFRTRLQFRPNNFRAPIELQRTMERLETARVPMSIWKAFINASVRLISMSGIKCDKETFINILIWVLSILADIFIQHAFLTTILLIILRLSAKHILTIITFIYDFVKESAVKLWVYVEKRLKEYCQLYMGNCHRYS